jgi:hypothetical protein
MPTPLCDQLHGGLAHEERILKLLTPRERGYVTILLHRAVPQLLAQRRPCVGIGSVLQQ